MSFHKSQHNHIIRLSVYPSFFSAFHVHRNRKCLTPIRILQMMLSSTGRAPLIVFSLLLWWRIQAQTCYYPDQTIEPSYNVCNASAQVSLCCQWGATCLTSGLCFLEFDSSLNTGTCTDKTWTSPSCFQHCPPSLGIDHGSHTLYRCNDNQWCCSTGGNSTSCCNDRGVDLFPMKDDGGVMGGTGFLSGFTIAPVELLQTSMSTAPFSALATPNATDAGPTKPQSSTAASTTTDKETPHPESTTRANNATRTGLGAGLGVGLPLLAGLTVALLFVRRLRSQSNSQKSDAEKKTAYNVVDGESSAHHERQELESLPVEMPNSRREITQELGV